MCGENPEQLREIGKIPADAVELVDEHRPDFIAAHRLHQCMQRRTRSIFAGITRITVNRNRCFRRQL